LRALKITPSLPEQIKTSAADELLGPLADKLAVEFDDQWRQSVTAWWEGRHQYAVASRTKLAALSSTVEELSIEDAFSRAELTEELGDDKGAREQLEALAVRAPEHAATQFALGRLRLANEDESGIALLRTAMQLDPGADQAACMLIVEYLQRHGRNAEARAHIDRLHDAGERDQAASRERGELRVTDKLLPHELAADKLAELVHQLRAFPDIRRVYLARKQTVHYQDLPLYVLAFERRTPFWKFQSGGAMQSLANRIGQEVAFPGETIIISLEGENKSFRKKFRAITGSQLLLED
jgi:hypothetical protein